MNKRYIGKLASLDQRLDGRKFDEWRKPIKLETGVSKNAEGSAMTTIGNTKVIAGVKLDIGEPYPDSPDQGNIIVTAELLPLSSPHFETGPPGPEAVELARVVDRGIRESKAIDLKKLCIKKGEKVWTIFIDIYTLNNDGNLIDASAMASIAALSEARIPKVHADKVMYGELSTKKLPLNRKPLSVSLYKVNNKILVDATLEEEDSAQARLTVAVTDGSTINAIQKGGSAGLTENEISEMLDLAIKKSKDIIKYIK